MPTWITIIIAAMAIINSWILKWVDLDSKTPATEKTKTRSSVYIRKYKTGIVIVTLLVSVATLVYLMLSTLPITKVTILLISLNVSAIFMAVLSWILIINNAKMKKLIEEGTTKAILWSEFWN
ncbi:MAG: hypothetical protein H0U18_03975 [Pyrinomonadaceae bacterium]|nr:hypothetical protein [Pyrinomonadaceae bacterium]